MSRIRIYCIWYQDGGGKWIQENIPEAYIYEAYQWDNVWDYESYDNARKKDRPSANPPFVQELMKPEWLNAHVKSGHGPLGALTPQKYISEGDTPSFLHLVNNGLDAHLDYTLGGWGGRAAFDAPKFPRHLTDRQLEEGGDKHKMFWRWVPAAQNDFATRMDWCVKEFKDANHHPVVKVDGGLTREVKPGATVKLSATATDPDGNDLTYRWWQYHEADSVKATVAITGSDSADTASFVVPNEPDKQFHVILEVTDNGTPPLTHYRRVIVSMGIAMTLEDSWGGDITTAAIAHLAHSTPEEFRFTSTDFNSYVTVSMATGAPQRRQGFMAASNDPGLGITPRMDVLGQRVVEVS